MKGIRRSVPTDGAHHYWMVGWLYVMPDFDKPNYSIIEWLSENPPVFPYRVPETNSQESADGSRTGA